MKEIEMLTLNFKFFLGGNSSVGLTVLFALVLFLFKSNGPLEAA